MTSLGSIICWSGSQSSGRAGTYYHRFIAKGVLKGTNKQPDEVLSRTWSGRVPGTVA